MRIVVGLGNPGGEYAGSRHNVGFAVVDELARRCRAPLGRVREGLRTATGWIAGDMVMLVEPQMYMNLSGAALAQLQPPVVSTDLVVIHDDIDLDLGCVRVKRGGGTAGHHGLDSIAEHLGEAFARVRVGVGRPPRDADVAAYVLGRFAPSELETAQKALQHAADAVECIIGEGEQTAMNRFNVRTQTRPAVAAASMGRK